MDFVDRDLRCVFCRAMFLFVMREHEYFRDLGFKHDPRYCEGCKARPKLSGSQQSKEMDPTRVDAT